MYVYIYDYSGSLLYMHICVTTAVWMYAHMYGYCITYSKGKHQTGKVAHTARAQLAEQGK